jgi:hypothetical protein
MRQSPQPVLVVFVLVSDAGSEKLGAPLILIAPARLP